MLERAVQDVAEASWRVADRISQKMLSDDDEVLSEALAGRLAKIFGQDSIEPDASGIIGASTNHWSLSAIVRIQSKISAFQAVSNHPASIYKAIDGF